MKENYSKDIASYTKMVLKKYTSLQVNEKMLKKLDSTFCEHDCSIEERELTGLINQKIITLVISFYTLKHFSNMSKQYLMQVSKDHTGQSWDSEFLPLLVPMDHFLPATPHSRTDFRGGSEHILTKTVKRDMPLS